MDHFAGRVDEFSSTRLVELLKRSERPLYESELLRAAFDIKSVSALDSLALYQYHFVLFYHLYLLQDDFYKDDIYLHIHFMRTKLTPYPEAGLCRHYDDASGHFCGADVGEGERYYCPFHYERIGDSEVEALSMKYFYLDRANFDELDAERAEQFVNGTWEVLGRYKEMERSFKILGLPITENVDLIKRRFKELAREYHPDITGLSDGRFSEINSAYRLIMKLIRLDGG